MEHFYNYIQTNKFDSQKFSNANVLVTLKVDGTPFQISFSEESFTFRKRSKDEKTEGPQITRMDAFTNPAFYPIMVNLNPILKQNISKFNGVKLLNCEILVENEHHVIQYNQKPKGNLCVLNGITTNDKTIDTKMIQQYANILQVESVPIIYNGVLGDKLQKIVDFVKQNCDPHNPKTTQNPFKDEILNILQVQTDSPLMDTKDGNIEGFVFDFSIDGSHTLIKIDDPSFVQHGIDSRNNEKSEEDVKRMDDVLHQIYNYFQKKNFRLQKLKDDEDFDTMLRNFETVTKKDSQFVRFLNKIGKSCMLGDMLYSSNDDMLPKSFKLSKGEYSSDEILYALRLFVWLFNKKKTGKNYPILKEFKKMV